MKWSNNFKYTSDLTLGSAYKNPRKQKHSYMKEPMVTTQIFNLAC